MKVCLSMCLPTTKRSSLARVAVANACMGLSCRLYVTDKITQSSFLIDIGSYVSCFPKSCLVKDTRKSDFTLYADNGTIGVA